MIKFLNNIEEPPFIELKKQYDEALSLGQENPEALALSSYSIEKKQVNSRFVNLKFVDGEQFIFFTNYNSPKAKEFFQHKQISALMYWNLTRTQIRIKGNIFKADRQFNQDYFKGRSINKNALAISSNQSNKVESFEDVKKKYNDALKNSNLKKCPDYWGAYIFIPFEIEFWRGSSFRLNKRDLYQKVNKEWNHSVLEP